jgi:hypothetical protein
MASGDIYSTGIINVPADSFLDFRPDIGNEITLHNIHASDSFELQYTDGVNFIICDFFLEGKTISGLFFECDNSSWYRIKNTFGSSQLMAGSGRYSKWVG